MRSLVLFALVLPAVLAQWETDCGQSFPSKIDVVGGDDAAPGQFPFAVSLRSGGHFCGGTILNSRWIITAAHCVRFSNPDNIMIRVGELDFSDDSGNEVDYAVEEIINHSWPSEVDADISLLRTTEPIVYNDFVQPACDPPAPFGGEDEFVGEDSYTIGWGNTDFGGPSPDHLQWINMPIVSADYCAEQLISFGLGAQTERQICSGETPDPQDAYGSCHGDSGGPLVLLRDGRWHLVGAVSGGYNCVAPGYYTRINSFRDWIAENAYE